MPKSRVTTGLDEVQTLLKSLGIEILRAFAILSILTSDTFRSPSCDGHCGAPYGDALRRDPKSAMEGFGFRLGLHHNSGLEERGAATCPDGFDRRRSV
jgi:hypothetical protein